MGRVLTGDLSNYRQKAVPQERPEETPRGRFGFLGSFPSFPYTVRRSVFVLLLHDVSRVQREQQPLSNVAKTCNMGNE